MYVTDTHALIWYTQPTKSRLGKRATSLFEKAEEERTLIYVPSVVLWELADQLRQGTLRLRQRFDHWCRALDSKKGFHDPFDCLIAGTALRMGVPLITKDTVISESGLVETVW